MRRTILAFLVLLIVTPVLGRTIPAGSTDRYVPFVAVDVTDRVTRETGLSSFTVYYFLDDGSATAMDTPTVSEPDSTNMPGDYRLLIDEAGMTTLAAGHDVEILTLEIQHASMAPVTMDVDVVRIKFTEGQATTMASTGVYADARLIEGTDATNQIGDATWDEAMSGHTSDGTFGGDFVDADDVSTVAAAVDAVWDEAKSGHTDDGTFGGDALDADTWTDAKAGYLTGDAYVRIGAAGASLTAIPWNASWDAEVESEVDDSIGGGTGTALTAIPWNASWDAEVESEVDDSIGGGTGTALTAVPWNASWDAEVQSEVNDGLVALNLDHLLSTACASNTLTNAVVDYSVMAFMMASGADISDFTSTTDSMEAMRDRGDAAWIGQLLGDGAVAVDEDYGGDDALAYETGEGAGIDNAVVRVYVKTDYDAGNLGRAYIVAWTYTDVNGYFENDLLLDAGTYTFYYFKQGLYGPDTQTVVVTE